MLCTIVTLPLAIVAAIIILSLPPFSLITLAHPLISVSSDFLELDGSGSVYHYPNKYWPTVVWSLIGVLIPLSFVVILTYLPPSKHTGCTSAT